MTAEERITERARERLANAQCSYQQAVTVRESTRALRLIVACTEALTKCRHGEFDPLTLAIERKVDNGGFR